MSSKAAAAANAPASSKPRSPSVITAIAAAAERAPLRADDSSSRLSPAPLPLAQGEAYAAAFRASGKARQPATSRPRRILPSSIRRLTRLASRTVGAERIDKPKRRGEDMNYLIAICFAGLVCAGCATTGVQAAQPPKRIVQSPEDGLRELDIVARALPPIGNVLPIQLAVTNLTLKPLTLDPQEIRAERVAGASVAVLSVADTEQAAGSADQLAKSLPR